MYNYQICSILALCYSLCLASHAVNAQGLPVAGEVPMPKIANPNTAYAPEQQLSVSKKVAGFEQSLSRTVGLCITRSDALQIKPMSCQFTVNDKKGLENLKVISSSNSKQLDARILKILRAKEIAAYNPSAIGRVFEMRLSKNGEGRPIVETKLVR